MPAYAIQRPRRLRLRAIVPILPLPFRAARFERNVDDIAPAGAGPCTHRRDGPCRSNKGAAAMPRGSASLGIPLFRCNMPQRIGASSGAAELSNGVGSSLQLVADDVRAITEPRADTERPGSSTAPVDVDHRATDQAAAVGAVALYGIRRNDAVWLTECAWCKRVRSVAGDWQTLAPTVRAAMGTERTHGVCPRCAQGLMARAESADRAAR
jgi:hypothetical protein